MLDEDRGEGEKEMKKLIVRFETMLSKGLSVFFDVENLENIIDYYIELNKVD